MEEPVKTKCPVCQWTGKCLVCDGKKTTTEHYIETKGTWPFKKRESYTKQADCFSCNKTGLCPVCNGKGHVDRVIDQNEMEALKKMREHLLGIKEENQKKVIDVDAVLKEREKSMMRCPLCGTMVHKSAARCPSCSAEFETVEE